MSDKRAHGPPANVNLDELTDAEKRLLEKNEIFTGGEGHHAHKLAAREGSAAVDVQQTAEELKDKGNAEFKRKRYGAASGFYTRALKTTDDRGLLRVLYSNRSAARLEGRDPEGALADADQCLLLGPGWVKGLARRAAALTELHRFAEAVAAYEQALETEPTNETLVAGKKRALDGVNGQGEFAPKEEDPLAALFSTVEEIEKTAAQPRRYTAVDHDAETSGWTRENQLDRLLQAHHKYYNLNPYHVFGMATTANDEDIKKRFHKLSALVHPDKNPNNAERAREAFEIVKKAEEELKDMDRRSLYLMTFHEARERVEDERRAIKKKRRWNDEQLDKELGPLEAQVDKEIKKTLAANERARVHAEEMRQKNEEFLASRQKPVEKDWAAVKQEEETFREGADERLKSWSEFSKKARLGPKHV